MHAMIQECDSVCVDVRIDARIRRAEQDGYLSALTMVYSKRWSVASIQGGMSLTDG